MLSGTESVKGIKWLNYCDIAAAVADGQPSPSSEGNGHWMCFHQ